MLTMTSILVDFLFHKTKIENWKKYLITEIVCLCSSIELVSRPKIFVKPSIHEKNEQIQSKTPQASINHGESSLEKCVFNATFLKIDQFFKIYKRCSCACVVLENVCI